MESILRALSISLFLLSMERRSKDVFSVLQKNIILQLTLFLYHHVFPSSPKVKIYITNQQVFLEKTMKTEPNQPPKIPQNNQNHHQIQTNNQHQNTKLQQQQQKTQTKKPQHPTPKPPHKQNKEIRKPNKQIERYHYILLLGRRKSRRWQRRSNREAEIQLSITSSIFPRLQA